MADLTREEAVGIVDEFRRRYGGLSKEIEAGTPQEALQGIKELRKIVADVTKILTVDLYTKSTRFVYELIQNAEDNNYKLAKDEEKAPFLRFHVTRERIIIDSNEDGFTELDVSSICKVAGSEKKGIRGYIGEKGIGFKSVFTVASKVHVQSGPFSFYFKYGGKKDEAQGLGLITPFNCEHEKLPVNVRTRFTLTLMDGIDYESLVKEFTELPDTLLLFLSKLKTLHVKVDDGNVSYERRYERLYNEDKGEVVIAKYGSKDILEKLRFLVRKKTIYDLPPEEARENISDAEVVLAFPVDGTNRPIIEPQHVCAYLPMRKIGLPFQIQSDFITQASREDARDSDWNKALRNGVSEVFVEAMTHFDEHDTLRYVWPRYLPNSTVLDPFWSPLREMIINRLESVPIIRTYTTEQLKCISQLRFLPAQCCDEDGIPLFDDLPDEIYLSDQYLDEEVTILRETGLKIVSFVQLWDRLKADLRNRSSTMKDPQTSASWHSRCANFLLQSANQYSYILEDIQAFELIPLRDGSWTSIKSGSVFYHEVDGTEIPTDLGLRILAPEASTHPERKKLFDAIGVKYCDTKFVKKLIVGKYAKWNNVDLESSVSHLRFLFHHCPENEQPIHETMFLFDTDNTPVYRTRVTLGRPEMVVDDIYLDIPGAYNVKSICSKVPNTTAFNIHIIHSDYMAVEEATSSLHSLSWTSWLEKYGNVLRSPRLVDPRDHTKLSSLFNWIIKKRSDLLLGVLKTHWQSYKGLIESPKGSDDSPVAATLQEVKVRCSNEEEVRLHAALVPLKKLIKLAAELGAKDHIRFLQLPSDLPEASPKNWRFLSHFGACTENNIDFYLEALRSISSQKSDNQGQRRHNLIKIYEAIEDRVKANEYPRIRNCFKTQPLINARSGRGGSTDPYFWFRLDSCVYNGPDFLETHRVLSKHDDFQKSIQCERLFARVLRIPNANWSHTLGQISSDKKGLSTTNVSAAQKRMTHIYHSLSSDKGKDTDWDIISETFEREGLIYVPSNGWHSPSKCVWSDHTFVSDIFPISNHYSGLDTLFVQRLKVPSPTLHSQIRELQILCGSQQNTSEKVRNVRNLIKEISIWEPESQDVKELLGKSIIPVIDRHGREQLVRPEDPFAIVDRQKYGDIFRGKVSVLAISLSELRSFHNFLSALGLETHYTSVLACETSNAKNASADAIISQDFRKRALALLRCAIHFESPKVSDGGAGLYNMLKRTILYQSEEITTTVTLKLNGHVLGKQDSVGIFHFETGDSRLKVYVPKDEDQREVCYYSQLPQGLVSNWAIKDKGAVKVIASVLTARASALDGILSELGIPEFPYLQRFVDEELDKQRISEDFENFDHAADNSNARHFFSSNASTTASFSSFGASSSFTPAPTFSRATTPDARSLSFSTGRPFFSPGARSSEAAEAVTPLEDYITHYTQLLDKVINAGEEDNLPSNFGFVSSNFTTSTTLVNDPDMVFGIRSRDMMAHDMRIGAAGELYVFELLLCRLNSFDIDNWRSTIRHHVSVHQKYNELAQWTGRETADIVYKDHISELTGLLIAYGYLSYQWARTTPTYYLEVKTTNGPCDTRFFMSKAQVRRMREMRLDPTKPSADIYIILRVFNLTSDKIGMRILLDPATMEQEGKLVVEAEQYTVMQPNL